MRAVLAMSLLALGSCDIAPEPAPPPLLVVGVDGGDRKPIEVLWAKGELPHLRRLAARGTYLPLRTDYGKSPVIWTTIATGVAPGEHGIIDFVVSTASGDRPITSDVRRRPAFWNMLERVGRRAAVVGWWATWPAEPIVGGVIVSDRAGLGLEHEISPEARRPDLERWAAAAKAGGLAFGDNGAAELHDRIVTQATRELVAEPFDLVLAYYRSVDVVSHWQWHTFQPEKFPDGPPTGSAPSPLAEPVLDAYRAFDSALGQLLESVPPETSVMVLSDHGFRAERSRNVAIHLDFDRVLEALGFLVRDAEGIDTASSRAWTHLSPSFRQTKLVKLRPSLTAGERRALSTQLVAALARIRFPDGSAAFEPRDPNPSEVASGADLAVPLRARALWPEVRLDRQPIPGAVLPIARLTGTHDLSTRGILIVAGPLFARGADVPKISVRDIAPTLLYALGLPVALDFVGSAAIELLSPEFRATHPLRTVPSWGTRVAGEAAASARDAELVEELGALGYLR